MPDPTPREQALADLEDRRQTVAHWEAERVAGQAELDSLQSRIGEEVLADASAAERLPLQVQQLRDRVDIAARTVAAARPKVDAATNAALLAEAEEWDAEEAERQAVLDRHNARTAKLRKALEDHEGPFLPHTIDLERLRNTDLQISVAVPRSAPLADQVEAARRTAAILRALAADEDPRAVDPSGKVTEVASWFGGRHLVPADFPASAWGPKAVKPAPLYLDTVGGARDRWEAHQRDITTHVVPALAEARDAAAHEERGAADLAGRLQAKLDAAPQLTEELTAELKQAVQGQR